MLQVAVFSVPSHLLIQKAQITLQVARLRLDNSQQPPQRFLLVMMFCMGVQDMI